MFWKSINKQIRHVIVVLGIISVLLLGTIFLIYKLNPNYLKETRHTEVSKSLAKQQQKAVQLKREDEKKMAYAKAHQDLVNSARNENGTIYLQSDTVYGKAMSQAMANWNKSLHKTVFLEAGTGSTVDLVITDNPNPEPKLIDKLGYSTLAQKHVAIINTGLMKQAKLSYQQQVLVYEQVLGKALGLTNNSQFALMNNNIQDLKGNAKGYLNQAVLTKINDLWKDEVKHKVFNFGLTFDKHNQLALTRLGLIRMYFDTNKTQLIQTFNNPNATNVVNYLSKVDFDNQRNQKNTNSYVKQVNSLFSSNHVKTVTLTDKQRQKILSKHGYPSNYQIITGRGDTIDKNASK